MRQLSILLCFLGFLLFKSRAPAATITPTVLFAPQDGVGHVLSNSVVDLTPGTIGANNVTNFSTLDRLEFTTDSAGILWVTNMMPLRWLVQISGPYTVTPFYADIPATNGLINAFDYRTVTPVPPSTYTKAQSDAQFARQGTNSATATAGQALVTDGQGRNYFTTVSGGYPPASQGAGNPLGWQPGLSGMSYFDTANTGAWINNSPGGSFGWRLLIGTAAGSLGGPATPVAIPGYYGSGSPAGQSLPIGSSYWDTLTSSYWLSGASGMVLVIGTNGPALSGSPIPVAMGYGAASGPPTGVPATTGTPWWDTSALAFWINNSVTSGTNWVRLF